MPSFLRGARIDPGRAGAVALAAVAAVAAVLVAIVVWSERPRAAPLPALPAVSVAAADPAAPASSAAPEPAGPMTVAVAGTVVRPGLVQVPDGARVADVLDAAGGVLPGTDLSTLNLARRVADGEQVAVGVPPAPDAAPTGAGGSGALGAGSGEAGVGPDPVDLNSATSGDLEALPGVGPVTAQRILEWREANGRFARIEQLREVSGIGERRFAQLRDLVRV